MLSQALQVLLKPSNIRETNNDTLIIRFHIYNVETVARIISSTSMIKIERYYLKIYSSLFTPLNYSAKPALLFK